MAEVTNEFLARMIDSRFKATAAEFSAVHHRLDMMTTALNDVASTHATDGEVKAVHTELDRLRQVVTELRAQVEELRPFNGNGKADA
jgi:hypothetical protein